jgi:hypothetical protein
MSESPMMLVMCAVCEKRVHMIAHILCRTCFLECGGYFSQTEPTTK